MTEAICEKVISGNRMECTRRHLYLIFIEFCQELGSVEGKTSGFNPAKPTYHSFCKYN